MPTGKASRWSEAEKNALMVSIVASFGMPNWSQVKLPVGRSRMACMHQYYAAMEEAKGVALGDSQNAEAVKKRPKKGAAAKRVNDDAKGKRVHEEEHVNESDDSQAGERKAKKFKLEEDDEEGKASMGIEI
ncbi:MAG: hypothetical protein Q9213_004378 [Squamulea squamosa]